MSISFIGKDYVNRHVPVVSHNGIRSSTTDDSENKQMEQYINRILETDEKAAKSIWSLIKKFLPTIKSFGGRHYLTEKWEKRATTQHIFSFKQFDKECDFGLYNSVNSFSSLRVLLNIEFQKPEPIENRLCVCDENGTESDIEELHPAKLSIVFNANETKTNYVVDAEYNSIDERMIKRLFIPVYRFYNLKKQESLGGDKPERRLIDSDAEYERVIDYLKLSEQVIDELTYSFAACIYLSEQARNEAYEEIIRHHLFDLPIDQESSPTIGRSIDEDYNVETEMKFISEWHNLVEFEKYHRYVIEQFAKKRVPVFDFKWLDKSFDADEAKRYFSDSLQLAKYRFAMAIKNCEEEVEELRKRNENRVYIGYHNTVLNNHLFPIRRCNFSCDSKETPSFMAGSNC